MDFIELKEAPRSFVGVGDIAEVGMGTTSTTDGEDLLGIRSGEGTRLGEGVVDRMSGPLGIKVVINGDNEHFGRGKRGSKRGNGFHRDIPGRRD